MNVVVVELWMLKKNLHRTVDLALGEQVEYGTGEHQKRALLNVGAVAVDVPCRTVMHAAPGVTVLLGLAAARVEEHVAAVEGLLPVLLGEGHTLFLCLLLVRNCHVLVQHPVLGSHEGSDGVTGNGPVDPLEGDSLGVAWVAVGVPRYRQW